MGGGPKTTPEKAGIGKRELVRVDDKGGGASPGKGERNQNHNRKGGKGLVVRKGVISKYCNPEELSRGSGFAEKKNSKQKVFWGMVGSSCGIWEPLDTTPRVLLVIRNVLKSGGLNHQPVEISQPNWEKI